MGEKTRRCNCQEQGPRFEVCVRRSYCENMPPSTTQTTTATSVSDDVASRKTKKTVTRGFTPRIYPRPIPNRTSFQVLRDGAIKSVRGPLIMTFLCIYIVFPIYSACASWYVLVPRSISEMRAHLHDLALYTAQVDRTKRMDGTHLLRGRGEHDSFRHVLWSERHVSVLGPKRDLRTVQVGSHADHGADARVVEPDVEGGDRGSVSQRARRPVLSSPRVQILRHARRVGTST